MKECHPPVFNNKIIRNQCIYCHKKIRFKYYDDCEFNICEKCITEVRR
jgi:hypothetical protein